MIDNSQDNKPRLEGGNRVASTGAEQDLPVVSIITVTLNLVDSEREDYFRQMMSSIAEQSFPRSKIEHIIIDGGSVDGSLDLIREYAESGAVDYWISEPDEGIYDAMNKGWQLARGKYINYINSDDYFLPDAVESVISAIEENDADYGVAAARFIKNDELVRICRPTMRNILFHTPYCHQTLFAKRECYTAVGGFSAGYQVCADWLFMWQMYLRGFKYAELDKTIVVYRVSGESADAQLFTNDAIRIIETFAGDLNLEVEEVFALRDFSKEYTTLQSILDKVEEIKDKELALLFFRGCVDNYLRRELDLRGDIAKQNKTIKDYAERIRIYEKKIASLQRKRRSGLAASKSWRKVLILLCAVWEKAGLNRLWALLTKLFGFRSNNQK